ncbi:MAG: ABC transporter substrate-binding protein [Tissierellia bacterium]|nr:ABC transporter substrate-binding protein [Tissierellia bacterium]
MRKNLKLLLLALVLSLALFTACQKAETKPTEEITAKAPETEPETKNEEKAEEKVEIDEETGLEIESEIELKYAKSFKLENLSQGVIKFTDVEDRVVYMVPEGVELENKDLNTLKVPVNNIAIFSTVDATTLRPIDELDKIVAVTTKLESWRIPEVKERMEQGEIQFLGSKNAIDYELLESVAPDVVMFTYENLDRTPIIIGQLNDLGINWVGVSNHMEDDPRARLEWVKLSGVLTGKLEEAEKYFDEQVAKISAVEEKIKGETNRPTFASVFMSKDIFYVRNAGDYNVKMLELAGGDYIFKDLNPDKNGNTKMNAEEFYKGAKPAEFILYDAAGAPSIQSTQQLVEYADFLEDLEAIKANKVWATKRHYYQSADKVADMIEELHLILQSEPGELTETEHFYLFSLGGEE